VPDDSTVPSTNQNERIAELFLGAAGNGCAETAFVVLKEAFGLADPESSAAAMALNGGIAYSGGTCGAVTGAALAVGLLAEGRIADHPAAKSAARRLTAETLRAFEAEFGSSQCRALTGFDLRTEAGHRRFIEDGAWRVGCTRQIEFVVANLAGLANESAWRARLEQLAAEAAAEEASPAGS